MVSNLSSLEFFLNIPDDVLVDMATENWVSIERLCVALTLDLQIYKEKNYDGFSNRRDMC